MSKEITTELDVTFTTAQAIENITSGENISLTFGKLSKWFSALKSVVWSGDYADLVNKPGLAQNGTVGLLTSTSAVTNVSGYDPCPVVNGVPYYKHFTGVERYGVKIDKNNSDPYSRVEYMYDAVGFTPAKMVYNSTTPNDSEFTYGSWANAFFVLNNYPVMCKYDGTEDYKLNTANHALKPDGTASDASDPTYGGNAMSCFDCRIWIKRWEDSNYEYYAVSNIQYDEAYKDYPYIDENGVHATKLYYPMFKGSLVDGRLRSIMGTYPQNKTTSSQELAYAAANGANWSMGDWAHREWLNVLLLLLGKCDDTQTTYGEGCTSGGSDDSSINYGFPINGSLSTKGQFFGYATSASKRNAVKVFYIENWWGTRFDRCLGLWNDMGSIKVAWTPPYSATESTYCTSTGLTVPSTGWQAQTSNTWGRLPVSVGGSSSKYTCDYFYSNTSQTNLAFVGGAAGSGSYCGAWCVTLSFAPSDSRWIIGASPYLKQPS